MLTYFLLEEIAINQLPKYFQFNLRAITFSPQQERFKKKVCSQKREEYQELDAVNLWLDAIQYVLTWKASYLANTIAPVEN